MMIFDVGPGEALTTIAEATDIAMAGDTVVVHAGTYDEDLDLTSSGTDAARIVIETAGDGMVVVRGSHSVSGDYWDLQGLLLEAASGDDGLQVEGSYNRFLSIELTGGDKDGIDGAGVGNEVRGSRIHLFDAGDSDAHCIVLNPGAEDWVIDDNELFDCSGDSIQLYAQDAERTIKNTTISNNLMYWSGAISRMENAVDVKNADGLLIVGNEMYGFTENKTIVVQKGPIGVEVRCNVIHDGFTGVEFRAEGGVVEDIRFVRNLMYGMSDYGLKLDGVVGAVVLHNTFVGLGSDGLRVEGADVENGSVQNNLWSNTGSLDASSGITADHNAFFMTGSVGFGSSSDVEADPLLDAGYKLLARSPLIDAGVDVGGDVTGSAPDIGWNELGMDACGEIGGGGEGGGSASGGAGAGGSGAASASGGDGAGAAPSTGGATNGDDTTSDDEGCSCEVTGARSNARWAPLLLAATLARRRRRRTS